MDTILNIYPKQKALLLSSKKVLDFSILSIDKKNVLIERDELTQEQFTNKYDDYLQVMRQINDGLYIVQSALRGLNKDCKKNIDIFKKWLIRNNKTVEVQIPYKYNYENIKSDIRNYVSQMEILFNNDTVKQIRNEIVKLPEFTESSLISQEKTNIFFKPIEAILTVDIGVTSDIVNLANGLIFLFNGIDAVVDIFITVVEMYSSADKWTTDLNTLKDTSLFNDNCVIYSKTIYNSINFIVELWNFIFNVLINYQINS